MQSTYHITSIFTITYSYLGFLRPSIFITTVPLLLLQVANVLRFAFYIGANSLRRSRLKTNSMNEWVNQSINQSILTIWTWVLEKLTVTELFKKLPAFYGTRRFITVFTRPRHWSLTWARWNQSTLSPRSIRYILYKVLEFRSSTISRIKPNACSAPIKVSFSQSAFFQVFPHSSFLEYGILNTNINTDARFSSHGS
jgi:hypothetical protein